MLPNLIIIGAMKCATTSVHYYLGLHPEISMSQDKELDFFVQERNWQKGQHWYASHFTGEAQLHGESSPNYTNFPFFRDVPARMAAVVPETKLLYLLRDPIERIVSHYIHEVEKGRERRTFTDALTDLDANPYVLRSCYALQIEQYLPYFPLDRMLLVAQEDLQTHRQQTLRRIFRFLGVEETFSCRRFSQMRHQSRHKRRPIRLGALTRRLLATRFPRRLPPDIRWHAERALLLPLSRRITRPVVDEALRQGLIHHLQEDVRRLRTYAGDDFSSWGM